MSVPRPETVFTPRAAVLNPEMYVPRRYLEDMLISALKGKLHIVIQGESGTGKSWLYKKVLADLGGHYIIVNLANASRFGSITAALKNAVDRSCDATKTGYEEEKTAGVDAVVASAEVKHTGQYVLGQPEPFEECLFHLRKKSGAGLAVLVFDNLEAAFTDALLKELADLLILCDDEVYARHNVHIIIVGATKGIKEYYYRTPHHVTVSNRLYELPEVARLSETESTELLRRGLLDQLQYNIVDFGALAEHVAWITDRVPQMLHEYGLELANLAEENAKTIDADLLEKADDFWMWRNLTHPYDVIEGHMNERETRTGRRNQALYALGCIDREFFKSQDVENVLRKAFPLSTHGIDLNIPQILAGFAKGDRPLVRRSPKGDAYTFVDPRYRVVLRVMLAVAAQEQVQKRPLYR